MISLSLERFLYLLAAVLFVTGLKRLGSPDTARRGNQLSSVGMLIAVVVTLLSTKTIEYGTIVAGLLVGGALGLWMARTVAMTSMPQMVALLNGVGGGASLLVASAEYLHGVQIGAAKTFDVSISTQLGVLIGAVTLTGSAIAWAKLQEVMTGKPIVYAGQKTVNALLFATIVGIIVWLVATPAVPLWAFYALIGLALLLGVLLVIPIGGADMPVVISLLNSYSGIAAAMTGFVIKSEVLVISGALVGSSGIILSQIMCKAMNRSLTNVLFGAFGAVTTAGGKSAAGLTVKETNIEEAALQLAYAQSVIVVPGYGLAVAQAQHQVRELMELIEKRGGTVKFAIHPVAGRMPGHMNVLLAEANIPYDKLVDMDEINGEFERTDVCLVIGANDVVNPAARTDASSPIFGMPILNADYARRCIVMKRGMSAGFAGIENELFYGDKTQMLFGNAKDTLVKLVSEVKQV
ncbi:MAG TPA: NAD(P)(+) transhydrogenase (Re/Si-specific) subunit beta [Gemmatimonadaceae bacterium]|nr:NAD(P)(+) transhydrogenase (Re/Si-specific) subunit beta [Gemmatimonadaceae bacterium]HRQ78078.1 NAD(P)(+) transhydrogenase (Re/Si-specific) subunit beta [Gemmatimonadaceae bacterium]